MSRNICKGPATSGPSHFFDPQHANWNLLANSLHYTPRSCEGLAFFDCLKWHCGVDFALDED